MKEIFIKSLSYNNFRGQTHEFRFGSRNILRGRNRSGKSTCINALLWLLTDADIEDKTKFELFDNTQEMSPDNIQTCSVSAEFTVDGALYNFAKTAKQKWTRARGEEELTKSSSDDYRYFVDGLEVAAGKYNETVAALFAPLSKLKLILNLGLWEMLDWRELRNRFSDIVGEISPSDFKGDYSDVIAEIQANGAPVARDMFHKLISNKDDRNPGYEKQKDMIEVKIEAWRGALPDLSGIDAAEARIAELTAEQESIDATLLGLRGANDDLLAKRKAEEEAIAAAEDEYRKARAEYNENISRSEYEVRNALAQAEAVNRNNKVLREQMERRIADLNESIKTQETLRKEKLSEVENIERREFDGKCPICGSEFSGQLKADRINEFRTRRDADREAVIREGKSIRARIDKYREDIAAIEAKLSQIKDEDLSARRQAIEDFHLNKVEWEKTALHEELKDKILSLRESRTEIPVNPDLDKMLLRKGEIMAQLKNEYEITALQKTYDGIQADIERLEARLKSVVSAMADCERKKMLCEQYIAEEADIIRYRANKFFPEDVEVIMQKRKKDGDFTPCCEMRFNGVYGSVNTEGRMQIGVAIAKAFMTFYEVRMPLLIDNAEGIDDSNLPDYDGQMIVARRDDCDFEMIVER